MKLFAALGPGDIVKAHKDQIAGRRIASETALPYSGQIAEYCRANGIELLGVSHNPRADVIHDGSIRLINDPSLIVTEKGAAYHLAVLRRALRLAIMAKSFGADIATIDSGVTHYFALGVFSMVGIPTIVDFHNTLWPTGFPPQGLQRLISRLDGLYFRFLTAGTIGNSEECGRQVRAIGGENVPFYGYKAQFNAADFNLDASEPPDRFTVVYAGRLEEDKGATDLIEIAKLVEPHGVSFIVCGDGSASGRLQNIPGINLRGKLNSRELAKVYASASAVIVPTRSTFREGLPRSCIEAVFHGLPLITSILANATDSLGPAVVLAEPNSPASYAAAILHLARNRARQQSIRRATADLTGQFLDRSNSLPAALDRLLTARLGRSPASSFEQIFSRIS